MNPRARDDAAAHDEYLAANGRLSGPLHGVPILVKDQVETAGIRTTFGSILFEDYVPQRGRDPGHEPQEGRCRHPRQDVPL